MSGSALVRTGIAAAVLMAPLSDAPLRGQAENDGKREFTVTGCLLRAGYAGYQMDGVTVDAVESKPVPASLKDAIAALKKWTLQGGGNLGPRVGEKVQIVGRSDWQDGAAQTADEPPKPPSLDVKTVKTVADSCS